MISAMLVSVKEKSKELISHDQDFTFLLQHIDLLRDIIRFHEHRYYVMNDPLVADFEFDQLPEDFDHFEPILEAACERMPMLAEAGIQTFFNGPESFTPDDAYHLGLAPELDNFWVAAGFNSIGIQSAGGAGMALAEWMDSGEKPFDLGDVDISRMQPFQGNKKYLFESQHILDPKYLINNLNSRNFR